MDFSKLTYRPEGNCDLRGMTCWGRFRKPESKRIFEELAGGTRCVPLELYGRWLFVATCPI